MNKHRDAFVLDLVIERMLRGAYVMPVIILESDTDCDLFLVARSEDDQMPVEIPGISVFSTLREAVDAQQELIRTEIQRHEAAIGILKSFLEEHGLEVPSQKI